jgi:hypothetical protein
MHDLRPGIFNRLGRRGRRLRILLSRPGLELIDQGSGSRLIDSCHIDSRHVHSWDVHSWHIDPWHIDDPWCIDSRLTGLWLVDFGLILKGNLESGKQFIARRGRRQGLSGGG